MTTISVTGDIAITQHDQLLCRLHDQLGWRATDASRRVLADREQFLHSSETAMQWEKLNEVPACEQGGLCRLMNLPLPLPFGE
ncbi:hypothetical protein AXFE_20040 [Acidithrix ferrooxidans]|uniref:Uncharacterized protein n=1 Tax=Acidithrix ferrooxidans TaxID=1280514 RepID=A0A0D8HGM3_9ACTN|nr:hypothetical protein AXFE_20040 [Acidithrix ferrooxidans]